MDKLRKCADEFDKLTDVQYNIIIGRKGKTIKIQLRFYKDNFHHLLGLHKLKDLSLARENRGNVFEKILAGEITLDFIKKSQYYSNIKGRLEPLTNLGDLLESDNVTFKYSQKFNPSSKINADYLLTVEFNDNDTYIFIKKFDVVDEYFCRSLFPKTDKDYTAGQTKFALLYKDKVVLSSDDKSVLYQSSTFLGI